MATAMARKDIAELLYRQGPVQRFTQDSPVLPDVWLAFAQEPDRQQDLLLTPFQSSDTGSLMAGQLASTLQKRLNDASLARAKGFARRPGASHAIAYNQSTVAVRLYLDELVRVVLPMSNWWVTRVFRAGFADEVERLGQAQLQKDFARLLAGDSNARPKELGPDLLWMVQVIGTIVLVKEAGAQRSERARKAALARALPPTEPAGGDGQKRVEYFRNVVAAVGRITTGLKTARTDRPLVHLVSRNRPAGISVWRSGVAIKSDAARRLFELSCGKLAWAIIDSGIDATHPAFQLRQPDGGPAGSSNGDETQKQPPRSRRRKAEAAADSARDWTKTTRVLATYDFTVIRKLLSTDPADINDLPTHTRRALDDNPRLRTELRRSLQQGREVDWAMITPLIKVPHDANYPKPLHEHGTHVAGILAADWRPGEEDGQAILEQQVTGICPDIRLYDLRVLGDRGDGGEFNVMAALQFLRYLNAHKAFMVVHGANLSLSIKHEVMNYACGRTPVCEECERLVGAGITVVAAAGNRGYIEATDTTEESYRTVSITDPGNADGVITVGATHRDSPHTYGVSFFSSRGPTGDGRIKPDLVAPGEKIESCIPERLLKRLDGTSMAAPHVSGAAALLMARHHELIGQPRRIKEILCQTATDLGRERYFQGHGMVDVLRALQSV
jgi:hypothetical protein